MWGVLVLRLLLGSVMMAHGVMRLWPEQGANAGGPLFGTELLGSQGAVVVAGAAEIFVGTLLLIGLFVRLTILPLLPYLTAVLVHRAKTEPLISAGGSGAEEHLILIGMALALLVLGPGRLSLQHMFRQQ
jgi:putative oxidoreductase